MKNLRAPRGVEHVFPVELFGEYLLNLPHARRGKTFLEDAVSLENRAALVCDASRGEAVLKQISIAVLARLESLFHGRAVEGGLYNREELL